jgi:hypothetical protein
MKKYIYIDYENLPGVQVENIEDAKILIFLGENQKKIPTETIRKTQPMGDRVEWVTISGVGRNALDFHIAYYLAKNHTDPSSCHYIVSMDAGYDPLIKHVALFGQKVKRIITLEDIKEKPTLSKDLAPKYAKVLEILKKQDKTRPPVQTDPFLEHRHPVPGAGHERGHRAHRGTPLPGAVHRGEKQAHRLSRLKRAPGKPVFSRDESDGKKKPPATGGFFYHSATDPSAFRQTGLCQLCPSLLFSSTFLSFTLIPSPGPSGRETKPSRYRKTEGSSR